MTQIPHPFREWRINAGVTQDAMAERIGASQARVSLFESAQISRLEPEQAKLAELISAGAIKASDCLFDTPRAVAEKLGMPLPQLVYVPKPKPKKKTKAPRKHARHSRGSAA